MIKVILFDGLSPTWQRFFLLSLLLVLLPDRATALQDRIRGETGTISLLVAIPLTKDNQTELDPGFFHLSTASLAIDHFNERNTSIIANLDDLTSDCNITLEPILPVVDTGTDTHRALETITRRFLDPTTTASSEQRLPDAIAGPYSEIPTLELSVALGTALATPIVSHRAQSYNFLLPKQHPYFSHIGADANSEMTSLAKYLQDVSHRTNHIAVLHSTEPSMVQKAQILQRILRQRRNQAKNGRHIFTQVRSYSYTPTHLRVGNDLEEGLESHNDTLLKTLSDIKATGYRTVVWLPSFVTRDVIDLGPKVSQVGLDQDRLWVIAEGTDNRNAVEIRELQQYAFNKYEAQFMNGSAYLFPVDGYHLHPRADLREHLLQLDASYLYRVSELLPPHVTSELVYGVITETATNPFRELATTLGSWVPGGAFMYDAVMTIGIGACQALGRQSHTQASDNVSSSVRGMLGEEHLRAIRSVDFLGASGPIKFGGINAAYPGSRVAQSVSFAVSNTIDDGFGQMTNRVVGNFDSVTGTWIEYMPFQYPGGNTSSPLLLRDEPDQNYITVGARIFGLTLFAIATLSVCFGCSWVKANQGHPVTVAAQPVFLYILCLASSLLCFCILLSAFDESWGLSVETLDRSCIAWVWLDALGRMITYGVLFTKLWRANRILRFKTNQVAAWRIFWPCSLLAIVVLSCLTIWNVKSDYGWVRKEVDEVTGESVGVCTGETSDVYFAPIYFFNFLFIVLACIMAWKALGIDDLYSDSKWVLAFILVQIQVLLVSAPVIILLNESNPSARYVGLSLLTFSFPVSCMGLIILPKALVVRKIQRLGGGSDENPSSRSTQRTGDAAAEDSAIPVTASRVATSTLHREPQSDERLGPKIQMVTFE